MIKSILLKAKIEGFGIVNFDSNNQRFLWNQQKSVEKCVHKNVNFGKGRYYKNVDSEGNEYLTKVGVISSDCIRHSMYSDCMDTHMPNIMHDDGLLLATIANPAFVERGYLFAKDITWKRKSAFALSYARAIKESVPMLETFSSAQSKILEKSEDQSETSFFKREVRGDSIYELSGHIDIPELGFISMSDVHDRVNVHPDFAKKYQELLSKNLGSAVSDPAFFKKAGDLYGIPEYGIALTQDQVKYLVKDILQRLARFNLVRTSTGYARTVSLDIKFVSNPLEDLFNDEEGWSNVFDGKKFILDLSNVTLFSSYSKTDLEEEAKQVLDSYKKKYGNASEKEVKPEKKTKK
jgi:hypothetical protein